MANAITICRLLLIPVVFRLVLDGSPFALVVFAVAALTDLLDGAIARGTNQVTEFGRLLDPLTDRLFISSVTVALYLKDYMPPIWALALVLMRDALVLVGSVWLKLRRRKIEVTMLGKIATTVLFVAILVMVAGLDQGLWVFYAGLLLYLGSAFSYAVQGSKVRGA